jgi:hypothetical protein
LTPAVPDCKFSRKIRKVTSTYRYPSKPFIYTPIIIISAPQYVHTNAALTLQAHPTTNLLPPIVPRRPCIKPNQTLRPQPVPLPKQLRNINVQRTVRLRRRPQLMHGRHSGRNGVRRRPRRFEQVETDLARLEVHVGVADGRGECDCWRSEWVRWRY